MNPLLERIRPEITPIEEAVLRQANPLDAHELQSLVETYPELAGLEVRLPYLSNIAAQLAAEEGIQLSAHGNPAEGVDPFVPALGALEPGDLARHSVGMTLGAPAVGAPPPAVAPPLSAVDLRMPMWPVRDQNPRGTCVAFAATACHEMNLSRATELSEQFLYWAIKDHHDGQPTTDGTRLNFAGNALAVDGQCTEVLWPYQNAAVPPGGVVGGPAPPGPACADAATRTTPSTHQGGGTAAAIHASIAAGRPAAVSLPVFASASNPHRHNWNSAVGVSRGVVLNPPPTASVTGGHAVCVTGFVPNQTEPNGGYFVIRNSWGTAWGASGSPADSRNPEPGYGSVSATYVELYAWEWLQVW